MKYLEDVLISPVISEKSYDRISDSNAYTFFVHSDANKPEIKELLKSYLMSKYYQLIQCIEKARKKDLVIS